MSDTTNQSKALGYSRYLKIQELLSLQEFRSDPPEHDEHLFIVIHQVYELWFKQMLWEFDWLISSFQAGDRAMATSTLKRMLTILKTMVGQIDVLETMTPISFLSFRNFLESASGFQSIQFREIEFICGYKRPELIQRHAEDPEACGRLQKRLDSPSVWDAFCQFLSDKGYDIPQELLERDMSQPAPESTGMQEVLLQVYREDPDRRQVCELMVDLDEGFQEWRYRHVKMVERTIGMKMGTGGSPGAAYLQRTLFTPFFPDLWAIRSRL